MSCLSRRSGMTARTLIAGLLAGSMLTAVSVNAREGDKTYKTEEADVTVSTVTAGLNYPWGLEMLPDGRFLVTEKNGNLRIVTADGKKLDPIKGVPEVDSRDQGGLLDVTLDPAFAENRLLYVTYAEAAADGTTSTAAARGKLSEDATELENVEVIFRQTPKVQSTKHYGSRLVFDNSGHIFITTGERSARAYRDQAQDLDSLLGKVVRLDASDGSAAKDNPFIGNPQARDVIWSYGHRNVQGAAIHPETGQIWTIEHGPKGGDELNRPEKGRNYGWPVVSFGVNYNGEPVGTGKEDAPGFADPVRHWTPVIAPSGMTFYTGEAFKPWQGNLLIGALRGYIVRLTFDGQEVTGEERMLKDLGRRINDVMQGPDGEIYVLTDQSNGEILKIAPAGASG